MDYKDLDPSIRRGIKTITEYWDKLDKDVEIDDDEDMDAGILQLIEDTCNDRFEFSCAIDNLCNRFFNRFGYACENARIIKNKLMHLNYSDELNYEYAIKLLREFDAVSCCLADLDVYPVTMVETLYAIALLERHDDITQELRGDIWYIMSIYRGCPDWYIYEELLNDYDYDYTVNGFLSPEEREELANRSYNDNKTIAREFKYDPEIYGCCVKVRFPNNKTYRYNCRFDEIEENDFVFVTGKMKNIKGKVVERSEMWNTADYMEEVSDIVKED